MPPYRNFLYMLLLIGYSNLSLAQLNTTEDVKTYNRVKQSWADFKHFNFEKSLINSRIALNHATKKKNDYLIAYSYKVIAANYNELAEFDKAIFYYNKSLYHAKKINNDSIKHSLYNNLGNIYCFEKQQFSIGIEYYKKSIAYGLKINDVNHIYFVNANIAWAYFDAGRFKEGYPYLRFINEIQKKKNSRAQGDITLSMLNGMYSSHIQDYRNAAIYFKDAINFGKTAKDSAGLANAYLEYSKFLTTIKKFEEAYQNLSFYNKINEEVYEKQKIQKASVAGFNVEVDEYKREIEKIENEKLNQARSLKNSKLIVILFILITCSFLVLIFTLYTNITVKKKVNKELLKAKEIAEEALFLKSQFISTVSHELRTPLYGVVGITDLLLEEHKELAQSKYLNSLKFSARYLLTLVNDILQINKIEEKKVVLENSEFNISDEINMIKNSLSFLAQKNNNVILVDIDSKIPDSLVGDKLRLGQIMMNLISNALKFTSNGEVAIVATLLNQEDNFSFIEFQVKDNGIGIAKTDQSKVFDEFVQVGRKNTDYQGTGLGLSIVKKLLHVFGSSISLKSEVDKGTVFSFVISFENSSKNNKSISKAGNFDLLTNHSYKILVVEDNPINQIITRKIIEKNNYTCKVANDGFSAIEVLKEKEFDIILMDINMPVMNGFDTTKKIRSMGITIPVIALTAFDRDEIMDEALSCGVNDVLIKPFESEKLFKLIDSFILEEKNAGC